MVKSVAKTVEKWNRRSGQAGPDYTDGVQNPRKDWQEKTLAAKARYENEIQAAIAAGRREAGVTRKGTAGWKSDSIEKASRWPQGIGFAKEEYNAAMSEVLAFEDIVQKEVDAMPNATEEDRIARSAHWQRRMRTFKKS